MFRCVVINSVACSLFLVCCDLVLGDELCEFALLVRLFDDCWLFLSVLVLLFAYLFVSWFVCWILFVVRLLRCLVYIGLFGCGLFVLMMFA